MIFVVASLLGDSFTEKDIATIGRQKADQGGTAINYAKAENMQRLLSAIMVSHRSLKIKYFCQLKILEIL